MKRRLSHLFSSASKMWLFFNNTLMWSLPLFSACILSKGNPTLGCVWYMGTNYSQVNTVMVSKDMTHFLPNHRHPFVAVDHFVVLITALHIWIYKVHNKEAGHVEIIWSLTQQKCSNSPLTCVRMLHSIDLQCT